ncbi:hypothetical protein G4228_020499 [Cervus hanglu yarkandensis]|uniref:Uncharacterized protein n=1 Tax=Cervus hanglu yarkandensis TaxID=84702 RepID=A0A833S553_9CERV|nr:hypothetical protein G4228_020499 [Cervus hanglu yarkandensis]
MSSPDDEVSVSEAGFSSERGRQTSGLEAGSAVPRGPGPGPEPGAPQRGKGEDGDGFPDPEGFQSEWEVLETGGPVLRGRDGRPGSLANDQGDALQLDDKSVATNLHHLTDLNVLGTRKYLFQESYAVGQVSAFWDFKACPPSRGGAPQRCGEAAQGETVPFRVGRPKAGWAWGNAKRGTKSRLNMAVDRQWPPSQSPARLLSDPESSDEFSEIELMKVSIYPKDGGQAKLNRPEEPGNTGRRSNVHGRENLLNVPDTCLSSAPRGLISVLERQGRQGNAEHEDASPPKKMQRVLWGKGGNLPSYPRAAVASATAAAVTGSGPRPTLRRKGVQEKKSLGGVSKPVVGRTFPSWGQGISAIPLEPATFPPISGIPLLGWSKKYVLVLWGAEESKNTGAGKKPGPGKKPVTRQAWESVAAMAVSGEENDPNRDPFPKGQLTTDWPLPSCPWVYHGEPSGANLNIRGAQDSGNSEPVAMNKGDVRPRGPGPSGECLWF